jgi:hypothetical protein
MDIGEEFDEESESITRANDNDNKENNSNPSLNDEPSFGEINDKDDAIQKIAPITGIVPNIMVLDKSNGRYLIRFNSIYNEKDCCLELYYLDSNGTRYKPNIYECKINGFKSKAIENKVDHFKIKNKHQYSFELTTDMKDYYRFEVELYVYK